MLGQRRRRGSDRVSLARREHALSPLPWKGERIGRLAIIDRKSTRLNSSHLGISYAVFCLKKKTSHFHIEAAILRELQQAAFAPPANRIEPGSRLPQAERGEHNSIKHEPMGQPFFPMYHQS